MQIPKDILQRISQILDDASLSRDRRDSLLAESGSEAWHALFPEGADRLSEDEVMRRWDETSMQLSAFPKREQILRILESPASGERFYWLDSHDHAD